MRLFLVFIILSFGLIVEALAQELPQSVIDPYLEFQTADQAGNIETAADAAYRAWRAAVREQIEDQGTFLTLAQNAAVYAEAIGRNERAADIYEQTANVLEQSNSDRALIGRYHRLAANHWMVEHDFSKADASAKKALDFLDGSAATIAQSERIQANALVSTARWQAGRYRSAGRYGGDAITEAREANIELGDAEGFLAFQAGVYYYFRDRKQKAAYWISAAAIVSAGSSEQTVNLNRVSRAWRTLIINEMTRFSRQALFDELYDTGFISSPDQQLAINQTELGPAYPAGYEVPTPAERRRVRYPNNLEYMGINGFALVEYTVEVDGSVSDIELIYSPPYRDFGDAAVRSVERWKFNPATQDGEPVRHEKMVTRIDFEMRN